jgi:hypothetical protein
MAFDLDGEPVEAPNVFEAPCLTCGVTNRYDRRDGRTWRFDRLD